MTWIYPERMERESLGETVKSKAKTQEYVVSGEWYPSSAGSPSRKHWKYIYKERKQAVGSLEKCGDRAGIDLINTQQLNMGNDITTFGFYKCYLACTGGSISKI